MYLFIERTWRHNIYARIYVNYIEIISSIPSCYYGHGNNGGYIG